MSRTHLCRLGFVLLAFLFASVAHAQIPQVVAIGTPELFDSTAVAAVSFDPITNPAGGPTYCGPYIWTATGASGLARATDTRGAAYPSEAGDVWISWDNSSTPAKICVFLSANSVEAYRFFFEQGPGNGVITLAPAALGTAGANAAHFVQDFCPPGPGCPGLPAPVFNAVNGSHFNVAFSALMPIDAQYVFNRATCAPDDPAFKTCMAYGPPICPGNPIKSSFSAKQTQLAAFNTVGADPCTNNQVPAYKLIQVGATPLVILTNATTTPSSGFGNPAFSNINWHTLEAIYSHGCGLTIDVNNNIGGPLASVFPLVREPTAGDFNSMEWQLVRSRSGSNNGDSQETGNSPVLNPMNKPGCDASLTRRVIGRDEMVATLPAVGNSLGYGFYNIGYLSGVPGVKYLTLDGIDPIQPAYAGGNFPLCNGFFNAGPAFNCNFLPNYINVNLANYRAWSGLRATVYSSYVPPAAGPSVPGLIQITQDVVATKFPDFIPQQFCANAGCAAFTRGLTVFRSHYSIYGAIPHNGVSAAFPESGGDMAGAIFNDQTELDYETCTGAEFLTYIQ